MGIGIYLHFFRSMKVGLQVSLAAIPGRPARAAAASPMGLIREIGSRAMDKS
jgi:hypothetical protein